MDTLEEVERFTADLIARSERRKATYGRTIEGRLLIEQLLVPLAEFMLGPDAPNPPPGLRLQIRRLEPPEKLAFVALSPLLNAIAADWSDEDSAKMKVRLEMGRVLHDELLAKQLLVDDRRTRGRVMPGERRRTLAIAVKKYARQHWSDPQLVVAGNWLLECVLSRFPDAFVLDDDGLPCVTEGLEEWARELYADFVRRHPRFLPATEVPRDWIGLDDGGYWTDGSRIGATFVRDPHPETVKTVRRAFTRGSIRPHADGVSALQRVAWAINSAMLPVVERFGLEIGHAKLLGLKDKRAMMGAQLRVARDITIAKDRIGNARFFTPLSCDFRGRVYGIPDFNYQREDHVRALFQFDEGLPIGDEGLQWLMVHVATRGNFKCGDTRTSKLPFRDRIAWAENHLDDIERTARDPAATLDWWRDADAPFSFVAGCIELASAWRRDDPSRHVTQLPVSFDGSCSGIQHLAMLMRDESAGRLVNLTAGDAPRDIYQVITDRVLDRLNAADDARAQWWLGTRVIDRKLIKRPAMTFSYSVTKYGMVQQLVEVYRERCANNAPTDANAWYLAGLIEDVAKELLPRPAAAMEYIRGLAAREAEKDQPLRWTSPTGFPCRNAYYRPNVRVVHLECRGEYCRLSVGDGFKPGILKGDAMDAAAPNFVHSLDASHLIRVVNAATAAGITSMATVHDSFACVAPQASELRQIILREFAAMYEQDMLDKLRKSARSSQPPPRKGTLDPKEVLNADYAVS